MLGYLKPFISAEKSVGFVLVLCTLISLSIANSPLSADYLQFWQSRVAGLSLEHWVNDGLMAVFFLLVGLELEREIYSGELSNLRNALLPIVAALGGVAVPTLIHFSLNHGTPTQVGIGIPMATDIAFALGALAMLGSRVPTSLKLFLTALAVIDDLLAITVIAIFYTETVSLVYLLGSLVVFGILFALNRVWHVMRFWPYLVGGVLMWVLMLKSGVHATIAGVLLAFAIPFAHPKGIPSLSQRLEHYLHTPINYGVLPIFALANTGVVIGSGVFEQVVSANSMGIMAGLTLGKPLGITLFSLVAVSIGVARLPNRLNWKHIFGVGLLSGIGFTMSIFITNLAFVDQPNVVNAAKFAILLASLCSGVLGYGWFRLAGLKPVPVEQQSPAA